VSSLGMYFLCTCFSLLRYTQAGPFDVLPRCITAYLPAFSFSRFFHMYLIFVCPPPSFPPSARLSALELGNLGIPLIL